MPTNSGATAAQPRYVCALGTAFVGLTASLPLVIGQDLQEPYNFGIGRIFCFDTSNQGIDAGPDDLGERVKVYWFSPDEVTA